MLLSAPAQYRPPPFPPFPLYSSSSSVAGHRRHHLLPFSGGTSRVTTSKWGRGATVRCMANQRRVRMVAKQIQRELSEMLLTDKVLQFAVLPEASLGADRYISSLTTISDVEVSGDLQRYPLCAQLDVPLTWSGPVSIPQGQVVKVYVSVFGDERGREVAIAGLKSKAKYVRGELGRRMKLRLTPEIRFIDDESLERGSRVIAILDRLKSEKTGSEVQDEEQPEGSDSSEEDEGYDKDDPDEGIIYVK